MFLTDLSYLSALTLTSTLADLPSQEFTVDENITGEDIAAVFERQPGLPGVLIVADKKITGAFSRYRFLQQLGRPFGYEVYLRRPIAIMVSLTQPDALVLPATTDIHTAAQMVLQRRMDAFQEMVVVEFASQVFRLIDTYTLLLAQSQLLSLAFEAEQSRRQLAESFQKIGAALSSSLSIQDVTRRILKELNKVVPFDRGAVLLASGEWLESVYHRGFPEETKRQDLRIPIYEDIDDIYQRILRLREPIVIGDVSLEPTWRQLEGLPVHYSWLGIPLVFEERVLGMLSLTRQKPNDFSRDDVQLVKTFAGQATTALRNADLYEQIKTFNVSLEETVSERTAELNKAYRILEKLDKSKTDFISVTAHELRTPLTIIKGYAQMAQMSQMVKNDPAVYEQTEKILVGIGRMHRVVNGMLDVARIDTDSLQLSRERIAPAELVEEVLRPLRPALKERQLTVRRDGLGQLPHLIGDWELLEKLFHGLVTNAIKYTPDGRTITISGQLTADENDCPEIEFIVADEGIGIDPDQQELIFEKFYQTGEAALHSSGLTKFKGGGPGLGLAIARGVVLAHGGRIWVESDGHDETAYPGSRFFVRLPLPPGVEVAHVPTKA